VYCKQYIPDEPLSPVCFCKIENPKLWTQKFGDDFFEVNNYKIDKSDGVETVVDCPGFEDEMKRIDAWRYYQ